MLRLVRRKLREINYYSANRSVSGWTRAIDRGLFLALILAFPAVWVTDRSVVTEAVGFSRIGAIATDGTAYAATVGQTTGPAMMIPDVTEQGTFNIIVMETRHGFPFSTTTEYAAATITVDLFHEPRPRPPAIFDDQNPWHQAIERGMIQFDEDVPASTWRGSSYIQYHLITWLTMTGLWWLALSLLTVAGVRVVQLLAIKINQSAMSRRSRRLARGDCHECGYSLRGLEFNERCPECGCLVE